ncbi:MAG: hypothetical protein H0X29_08630 [Parachlamydiaceae bacterium]|nr:hypothetical protein [Parachlamydiaceae bacterium]
MSLSFNSSLDAFQSLTQSVNTIYSENAEIDNAEKSFEREYYFDNNKVNIIFHRFLQGIKLRTISKKEVRGSVDITMGKRNKALEDQIILIISKPVHHTIMGNLPRVHINSIR